MGSYKSTDSPAPGSPFNRSAQHDAKRTAILSQAARLFNYKGSRSTTLRDIAETLGLTKTSLYYYVKTKEELIYQCYMAALAYHLKSMEDIERRYSHPLDRARAFFLLQFENWRAAQEGRGPHLAALLEIASLQPPRRGEVEGQYVAMFKRLRGYLREGISQGDVRTCETISATRAMLGSLDWIFSWLHKLPRENVDTIARSAWDILEHGLYSGTGEYHPTRIEAGPGVENYVRGFDREEQNRLKQLAFYKSGTWFFNKKGFNGTSLDEIAEHLNVSKGAFYYHIKNKEDLLFNCYIYSMNITEHIYEQSEQLEDSGLGKIDHSCRRIFHVQNSEQGPLIRYTTITALPMAKRKEILERTDDANRRFGKFISAGIADGSVRNIDPFIAQQLISGAINASMEIKRWRSVEDLDRAAVDYFDLFFNGLKPR
ncbi:TetR/AcrR family transcriptional regulator [Kineobactrum sediminis]|uniref:TetR/AcrR family transcriptional regulator n=1 Tax=Kineobactrum sediminis TaxID=1905677 RepID=A0A2N5XZW4_9GAMM|nr:TetR/AcrR family transcriptional regulator [Kineobactrum sediminis]PLW81688.1 TetR/AcrR family transcriptional regulator [Kineobactrum sediminis]